MKPTIRHACLIALLNVAAWPAMARHHGYTEQSDVSMGSQAQRGSKDVAGEFDYYLMSLSWSPTYCLTHAGDSAQCGGTKGFGFVLHGLWPQYARGGYPQDCATAEHLTADAISYGQKVFPSPKLISHEWRKHGTCTGMSALNYFKTADQALVSILVPSALDAPAKTVQMTAQAIAQSFVQANPGLSTSAIAVACSGPELSEVRVCRSKRLQPQACGRDVKSSCRAGNIRIPAVR